MKNRHLFNLSLLFCVVSMLLSCKKEISFEVPTGNPAGGGGGTSNNTWYLHCKIDDVARTFDFNDAATISDQGGVGKSLVMVGTATSNASNLEGINLTINFPNGAPKEGTYTETYTGGDYTLVGLYNPNSTTFIYGAGIAVNPVLPLTITITKIDGKEASGSFQGAFYKTSLSNGQPTAEHVTITDGQFRLPVK